MSNFSARLKEWVKKERFHIDSFNNAIQHGLHYAVKNIPPVTFQWNRKNVEVSVKDVGISCPSLLVDGSPELLYPSECQLRGLTYSGTLTISLLWKYDEQQITTKCTKKIPLMVKSVVCNLSNLDSKQLREKKQEEDESGGYFIVNGKERIFRHFLTMRRNYPFAMVNEFWKKKGGAEDYTEFGVKMKCVDVDETISHTVLRYCTSGMVDVMFQYDGYYHFVPLGLLLKALVKESDRFIFESLTHGCDDAFYKERMLKMLRNLQDERIYCQNDAKNKLGKQCLKFVFQEKVPKVVADKVIKRGILIHLQENEDKFNLLCYMTRKLFSLVRKKCIKDDTDNIVNQEVLLSGQLYLMLLKHGINGYLKSAEQIAKKLMWRPTANLNFKAMVQYSANSAVWSTYIENALSTGNIPNKLGLIMTTGVSLLCERKNRYRFKSYFSAIEKFSASSYGSVSRRYLEPEAYGYICPVHTPDGEETGLKNHLAISAMITTSDSSTKELIESLHGLELQPMSSIFTTEDVYYVFVNGLVAGVVSHSNAKRFVSSARLKRNTEDNGQHFSSEFPGDAEIVFISQDHSLYPGIFILTSPGRLVRPLKNLATGKEEVIGILEQVFLHVCVRKKEIVRWVTSHQEISKQCILSSLAGTIPFCESNQSPKNILACQMAKQAIGIASHVPGCRSDPRLLQLTYPQTPIIRTPAYEACQIDKYPCGINAVIAVISYSGFDLEDAIVFNKATLERGLFHCHILKTEIVDLEVEAKNLKLELPNTLKFERGNFHGIESKLDIDGLPYVGQKLEYGDPLCCYIETQTEISHLSEYKSEETAYVQNVRLHGDNENPEILTAVSIQLSINRKVEVGDKFANRHGQKGVCGLMMAAEDMPFTQDGMIPDILFNPHGFPSRMTIGMMIEIMAGKAALLETKAHKIEPFVFSDKSPAVDYYCKELYKAGYNSYGTQTFISGVSGRELEAQVFTGVVYYQRLDHMVADKYQVRCEGKVDVATQQPVKAFPRDGPVKFGKMERDSLLSHGASFLLHDRFLECSDKHWVCICRDCKRVFSPFLTKITLPEQEIEQFLKCRLCENQSNLEIAVPQVFMYLLAELSFLNIKVITS